ncbi:MAG: tRNA (adenosine(37)-N6)-dimethylallyltransferase MiaA [Oscillospiraceae bacterium]|nr:tRNA (adenosine(37)-N6)-dimethylallyltransferase MiaA [Oscillospiraceae bacterium]
MPVKPRILVIAGPTASGKTALGVEMALKYNGEVISADSMQIYKGMDVATAKPTTEEMKGVPHHLIGFLDRTVNFSVADYVALATEKAEDIISRGKLPIVVGGTGLYISSFVNNIQFPEIKGDGEIRKRLTEEAEKFGNAYLLEKLRACDPETAAELHENDLGRVRRALEVFEATGRKMSDIKRESTLVESPFEFLSTAITYDDRQVLYDRINRRVDIMKENGRVDEAYEIYRESGTGRTAHQAIGCKELAPYFENRASLEECLDKVKQETRRYAKKQLTWLKKEPYICWMEGSKDSDINFFIKKCENIIAKKDFL